MVYSVIGVKNSILDINFVTISGNAILTNNILDPIDKVNSNNNLTKCTQISCYVFCIDAGTCTPFVIE